MKIVYAMPPIPPARHERHSSIALIIFCSVSLVFGIVLMDMAMTESDPDLDAVQWNLSESRKRAYFQVAPVLLMVNAFIGVTASRSVYMNRRRMQAVFKAQEDFRKFWFADLGGKAVCPACKYELHDNAISCPECGCGMMKQFEAT